MFEIKARRTPLQQQPRRDTNMVQQQSGSTDFQPRAQQGAGLALRGQLSGVALPGAQAAHRGFTLGR